MQRVTTDILSALILSLKHNHSKTKPIARSHHLAYTKYFTGSETISKHHRLTDARGTARLRITDKICTRGGGVTLDQCLEETTRGSFTEFSREIHSPISYTSRAKHVSFLL